MAAGFTDLPVSVNISTLQLLDSQFVPLLLAKLKAANVPPTLFHIELKETIFATNFDLLNNRLNALIAAGVEVGLDDFGTGFSSLSRIEELRFNLVKIDKSFIQKLTPENIHLSMIPEIINICQKFNLSSLAEGIETKEQYELLNNLGCKYGQGYYMSRPLEKDDALTFAKTNLANK
jgi:EAL domain-containing protein (putative c-di-GMP-specific phosphodiesterase class I)